MSQWFTGDAMANGIELDYYRTSGDKPPLVLSHASADNGRLWTRVARALAPNYDVIMYDQRGHGLSDAPESGYDFEAQALDLADLIAGPDLKHTRVIGHSGGAAIVTAWAANLPDLLSCVILEDPPWGSGWGGWTEATTRLRQWILGLGSKTREDLIAQRRKQSQDWAEEEVVLWAESKLQMSPNAVQIYEQPPPPWRDWIGRITCPLMLPNHVWGRALGTAHCRDSHGSALLRDHCVQRIFDLPRHRSGAKILTACLTLHLRNRLVSVSPLIGTGPH